MKSVTVAVPNMGSMKTLTVMSLMGAASRAGVPVTMSCPVQTYLHVARRDCVLEAQKAKTSHIWFVDSDMLFKEDALRRLSAHEKMIVGAHYNQRGIPLVSTMKKEKGQAWSGELPKHIFKCHAVATGCLLVDMRVFDRIEKPWFFYELDKDGEMVTGEDMWLCEQAHKAGIDVWCDPLVQVKHLGDFAY